MPQPRSLKVTVMMLTTLTILSGATIAPALPSIAEAFSELRDAEFLSKTLLTLPAFVIAVLGPVSGWLIDRLGRLKLLVLGLVLYALGGASGYFLHDLYLILAGRAVLGVGVAIIMTVTTTLVGDYFKGAERHRFLGIQGGFTLIGGIVFVGTGGVLADLDWRYPFLLYLVSLPLIAAVFAKLHEPMREKMKMERNADGELQPVAYSKKMISLIYAITFVYMLIFYIIPVQIPFLFEELGIFSDTKKGLAIVVGTASAAVTAFLYPRLRARLHYGRIYSVGFTVIAVGYGLVSSAQGFWSVIGALVIAGLGVGILMPNANLWVLSIVPERSRGKALGFLTTALFLGQFASPFFLQPFVYFFGLQTSFLWVAFVLVGLSIGFWVVRFEDTEKRAVAKAVRA